MPTVLFYFLLLLVASIVTIVAPENITPLPFIVKPIHYQLTIVPVLEENARLCGHVWIDVQAELETSMIILHAVDLSVARSVVLPLKKNQLTSPDQFESRQMVEDLCFNSIVYQDDSDSHQDLSDIVHHDGEKEMLTIILKENLIKGAKYRIGLLYKGNIYDKATSQGFFKSHYEIDNHEDCCKRIIGATQLEALHARKLFPCLDEPTYKATFQLMVGHSSSLTALANMPLKSSIPMNSVEEWVWDTFDTTPIMSTYLLACVLTEFYHLETTYNSISGKNITIRLWANPHKLAQLDFAIDLVPKILVSLENYLDVPYSLPKLDMIAIPGYQEGKAMENWGLVIHSEESLLLDSSASEVDKALVAVTVVHEIAHQWFGNLVTSSWWDDIWLNEGLTTLFESMILSRATPEIEYQTVLIVFRQEVMKTDLLVGSHALNDPITKFPTVDDKFDHIAYAKGAAIFRMAKSIVGEEAFQSAIRRYLQKYQYGNANSTDFWNILNQEARRSYTISGRMNIARIMKTWTQQPGYPLVHVHRGKNGIIHISQRPFRASDVPIDNATMAISASWWVPISMTSSENLSFSPKNQMPIAWLSPRKPSIEIQSPKGTNSWVLVNMEASGYYRVNYDRRNWDLLADQLSRNHTVIPYITRTQLVDDAFNLGHAKIIPYDVALQIIRYLGNTNDDQLIRKIAKGHIDFMQLTNENAINQGNEKMIKTMSAYVNQERKSRMIQFATGGTIESDCDAVERVCASEALGLFQAFINGSIKLEQDKSINSESMWCAAIRYGGQLEWMFAWNTTRLQKVQWPEKKKMLKAMSCTTDSAHVRQLLARVLHPIIKQESKDTSTIMKQLIKNPTARPILLNFLTSNWAFLNKHFSNPFETLELLSSITKKSYSIEELEKVKAFLTENLNIERPGANRVLAIVENNLRWLEINSQQGNGFLESSHRSSNNNIEFQELDLFPNSEHSANHTL